MRDLVKEMKVLLERLETYTEGFENDEKPVGCPGCGETPLTTHWPNLSGKWSIGCDNDKNCKLEIGLKGLYTSHNEAIKAWNETLAGI